MIHPANPTTAQQLAAANSRLLLESEPRPAFDLASHQIICTNPDAPSGQKNYAVQFNCLESPIQFFDGRHWENFPT